MKKVLLLPVCIAVSMISICQNVGISMTNPGFPLNFPGTLGDKISLWGNSGNHYGLGIQNNLLQLHTDMAASDIAFGYGHSASFTELMRIKGNGNIGIGTSIPGFPLSFSNTSGDKIALWGETGNHYGFGIQAALLQMHTASAGDDIAFGHGSSAAFNEVMRIKGNGNVGIGTYSPGFLLDVAGRMRLRNGNGGTAGIYFNKHDNSATSSFIGTYTDDNYIGIYGENGADWNILMNTANGNTGIGTVPQAKLHMSTGSDVHNGFLITGAHNGLVGSVPDLGAGSRMMFYPGKAAFRVGNANGSEWNNTSVGFYSVATGFSTTASGLASTAMGSGTVASGRYSTSMGLGTKSENYGGVTIGIYNDNTTTGSATTFDGLNRLFQIGNGTSNASRGNALTVLQSGYVAIGHTNPEQILDVADRIRLRSGPQGAAGLWLNNTVNTDVAGFVGTYADNYIGLYGQGGATWGLLMNTTNGNVGIGTNNPTYKLAVNGTIRSKEVRVESGWADFVFENDYKLPPLDEVESFIVKNKHLPGIPSAKNVAENGLAVGEMQAKMMQKIEELTLYLIEANKKIAILEKAMGEKK